MRMQRYGLFLNLQAFCSFFHQKKHHLGIFSPKYLYVWIKQHARTDKKEAAGQHVGVRPKRKKTGSVLRRASIPEERTKENRIDGAPGKEERLPIYRRRGRMHITQKARGGGSPPFKGIGRRSWKGHGESKEEARKGQGKSTEKTRREQGRARKGQEGSTERARREHREGMERPQKTGRGSKEGQERLKRAGWRGKEPAGRGGKNRLEGGSAD